MLTGALAGGIAGGLSSGREAALRDGAIGAVAGALLVLVLEEILLGRSLPPHAPEAYVGWNIAAGGADKIITKPGSYLLNVTAAAPTYQKNLNPTELSGALLTPDYRYRLDYLSTVRTGQPPPIDWQG